MKFAARYLVATALAGATMAVPALVLSTSVGAAPNSDSITAGPTVVGLPNTNIKGASPHFQPVNLSATGEWNGSSPCTAGRASFQITNTEKVGEDITLTGNHSFAGSHGVIPAKTVDHVCILKGWTGLVHATLDDGNRANINVS